MRCFHERWRTMSQIKDCHQLFKNQENLGPRLARQQSRPEPNRKFVGGLKNKVSEQQPNNLKHLENVIKTVWTRDKTSKYCC